jgi:hypothetical protein
MQKRVNIFHSLLLFLGYMKYTIKQGLRFNGKNFVEDNTIRFYFADKSLEVTPKDDEWEFSYFTNCLKMFCGCDDFHKADFHSISHDGEDRFYALLENEVPLCEIGIKAFNTIFEIEE